MRVRSGIFMAGLVLLSIACAEGVTLEEAWKMALKNHLTLEQQAVVLQRLEEELEVQKAGSLPRFGAMASYGYVSEVPEITLPFVPAGGAPAQLQAGTHNRYEAALTVEQPVFTGFRTRELVGVAREQVKAQGEQRAALREQVLLGVGRVYYQVQLTRLQQETLAQAIGRAEDHLKRVRNFYEAEQATAFDTLEVANRKLELVAQYRRLEHTEDLLRDRLAYAMNVADPPEVPALHPEEVDLTLVPLEGFRQQAGENRPELKELGFLREAQVYRVRAQASALKPQVYATAAYHYGRPGVNAFEDQWMGYASVGLSVRWTVWDWRQDRRRVKQAELEGRRLDLVRQQRALDVRQEVAEAYRTLEMVRDQIVLQRQLVGQERERYRITRDQYVAGQATSVDLSDAEKTLVAAEVTLQSEYVQWLQSQLQLNYAAGVLGSMVEGE